MSDKPLPNIRHERFCLNIAKGMGIAEAYADAGFAPNRSSASQLHSKPNIQARIANILKPLVEEVGITFKAVLEGLWKEAQTTGEGCTQAARVSAYSAVGKFLLEMEDRQRAAQADTKPDLEAANDSSRAFPLSGLNKHRKTS